jgi:WD40 repeat protein/predicted Ser/Thr protein kinase
MADELTTAQYEPDDKLHEVIALIEQERDSGRTPNPQDWRTRYPELASRLADYFADQEFVQRLAGPLRPEAGPEALVSGGEPETFPDVPGYEILEVIGWGGMGVVYKARQLSANRPVALKVIRPDRLEGLSLEDRRKAVERFITEAQAAAKLVHENIVHVHEVGEVRGRPFYSMRYVEGTSLHELIQQCPLEGRRAAAYVEKVARAVHEAHRHGILHRDLKPHNILVETAGDRPLVADFGLAKLLQGGQGITASGDVMGTPSYMSPEQSRGSTELTVATDVYGLGATLYALLTGRPPFQADDPVQTLRKVLEEEPIAPRSLYKGVDRDLETICLKCLEKEPSKRYGSSEALAGELKNWRKGEPISARPVGAWERMLKWSKRRPAAAGLVIVSTLAPILIVTGLVVGILAIADALGKVKNAKGEVDSSLSSEKYTSYLNRIALADREWWACNVEHADELLDACPPEFHHWEWHYLKQRCHQEYLTISQGLCSLPCCAFTPDSKSIISSTNTDYTPTLGFQSPVVKLRDLTTHQEIKFNVKTSQRSVSMEAFNPQNRNWVPLVSVPLVAVNPNGKCIALGGPHIQMVGRYTEGGLKVLDLKSGQEVIRLENNSEGVNSIAFSPDGNLLAATCRKLGKLGKSDGCLRVWDLISGKQILAFTSPTKEFYGVAFSPDGKKIGAACEDGTVKLWNANTGGEMLSLKGHNLQVWNVAFSPDSNRLASASEDKTIKVWDLESEKEILLIQGHVQGVFTVAYSHDGKRMISGSSDRTAKVWDAISGKELLTIRGHNGPIRLAMFSHDGQWIATAARTSNKNSSPFVDLGLSEVKLWKADEEASTFEIDPGDWIRSINPDKNLMASARGKVLRMTTGQEALALNGNQIPLTFNQSGTRIASSDFSTKFLNIWDTTDGMKFGSFRQGSPSSVSLNADGTKIASYDAYEVRVFDAPSGQQLTLLYAPSQTLAPWRQFSQFVGTMFSRYGDRLVTFSSSNATVWNASTGKALLTLNDPFPHFITCAAISSDGNLLALGGEDKTLKIWNVNTRREMLHLKGHSCTIHSLTFSPDNQRLASGAGDEGVPGEVKVWELRNGEEVINLLGHSLPVRLVAFNSVGTRLFSVAQAKANHAEIKVWDGTPYPSREVIKPVPPPEPD